LKTINGLCFGLLIFASNAGAVDLGIAAKVGINGVGIDLSVGLTENVNLRLSTAAIDVDDDDETVTVGDDGNEGDIEVARWAGELDISEALLFKEIGRASCRERV
jgi:hypothetical protein